MKVRLVSWVMLAGLGVAACSSDEPISDDGGFWSALVFVGDPVESYASVSDMATAADLIAVGTVADVTAGREWGDPRERRRMEVAQVQRNSVFALVGVLLALAVGFWVGRTTAPAVGASPAIDVARGIGVAIPGAQLPAFSDGQITLDEVRVAHARFVDCVEEGGPVDGFSSSIDDRGSFEVGFEGQPTPSDSQLIGACQIEHLDATRQTFVSMTRGQGS